MKPSLFFACVCAWALCSSSPATSQQEQVGERVAAIKASLAESQKALRQYEWVETTVVKYKGEEKARKQNRCYYGADKKLQKVPVGGEEQHEEKHHRGLRGRVAEHKKEEMTEEMKAAIELLKKYVPPDPQKIQAAKDADKVSFQPKEKSAVVKFSDYVKAGDSMAMEVDLATNRILSMKVVTYLDSKEKPIDLDVLFGALTDGTSYVSKIALDDKHQNLEVDIEHSGYRKMEQG